MGSSPPDPVLSGAPACVPPPPLACVAPSLPAHSSPAAACGKPHLSPLGSVHYPRCPPSGWFLHGRAVVVPQRGTGATLRPPVRRATLGGAIIRPARIIESHVRRATNLRYST